MSAAGHPVRACVIGRPIAHSLSPLIHSYWLAQHKINGSYDARDIAPEDLAQGVRALAASGYAGFNVTLPHKERMMALCDELDETAAKVGAVNTVLIGKDRRMRGSNTDVFGFMENLRTGLGGAAIAPLKNKAALVLGAGGAARAIIYGLQQAGMTEIRIANRSTEKAVFLAEAFKVKAVNWEQRQAAAGDIALLVNTTSLGMTGQPPLIFDTARLPSDAAVCDIVYRPLATPLLDAARKSGHRTVTGVGMLLHQARPAFAAWFGVMPEVTSELEAKILKASA